jgi:hypothetical protein
MPIFSNRMREPDFEQEVKDLLGAQQAAENLSDPDRDQIWQRTKNSLQADKKRIILSWDRQENITDSASAASLSQNKLRYLPQLLNQFLRQVEEALAKIMANEGLSDRDKQILFDHITKIKMDMERPASEESRIFYLEQNQNAQRGLSRLLNSRSLNEEETISWQICYDLLEKQSVLLEEQLTFPEHLSTEEEGQWLKNFYLSDSIKTKIAIRVGDVVNQLLFPLLQNFWRGKTAQSGRVEEMKSSIATWMTFNLFQIFQEKPSDAEDKNDYDQLINNETQTLLAWFKALFAQNFSRQKVIQAENKIQELIPLLIEYNFDPNTRQLGLALAKLAQISEQQAISLLNYDRKGFNRTVLIALLHNQIETIMRDRHPELKITETQILAQGGMGTVLKVTCAEPIVFTQNALSDTSHWHLASDFVVKIPFVQDPTDWLSFMAEGAVLLRQNHPVLGTGFEVYDQFLVMEYCSGHNLFNLVEDRNSCGMVVERREAVNIMSQVARGLQELHQSRSVGRHGKMPAVLYRDLKPNNIMWDIRTGMVKLLDFGLVCKYQWQIDEVYGVLGCDEVGNSNFMAPEQKQDKPLDFSADIYSFCLVFAYLLCGQKFDRPDGYLDQLERNGGRYMYEGIIDFLEKGLQANPEDRWQNTSEVISELEKLSRIF